MAIVGTAYVRLRVIGDKLKGDITKATENAVQQSAPNLAHSGEEVGKKVSDGVGKEMERSVHGRMGKVADEIGDAIGTRMAENMGRSLRRRAGDAISNGIKSARVRTESITGPFQSAFKKFEQRSKEAGKKGGLSLKNAMVSVIAGAITIAPSVIAFAGAIAGALVSTALPAIASLGPAAAGAALTAVAAFGAMKISAGLFGLAMKAETDELKAFKKRVSDFKGTIARPIQTQMFSGFVAAMRISQPIIAGLTPMLAEFGTNVGDIAIHLADTFRQGENLQRLQRILTANNDAVKIGGGAVTNLAVAFSILLDHLSPITLFLAQMVKDISDWALSSIRAAEASGQLDAFITRMFNSMRFFVGILVDFGIGIWNVFRAAWQSSGGMVNSLAQIARNFRAWTGDPANQTRMIIFFDKMRRITQEVLSIFRQLSSAAGRGLESTNVESVVNGLRTLVSVGQSVGRVFEQIRKNAGPGLTDAFKSFADMLVSLSNSGVLGILAGAFANLFKTITFILNIPGVGQLLSFIAGLAVLLKTVNLLAGVFRLLWPAISLIIDVLVALAAVVGWIPIVIAALVAGLIWFFTQTKIGREIIAAVWDFIKNAISAAVDWIIGAWDAMVAAFKVAWQWVANIAGQIWNVIKTVFTTIVNFYIMVWTTIFNVVKTIFTAIWNVIQVILNVIYQIWIRIWPLLALPIRILYGVIILIWNAIYAAISWAINKIWEVITTVWNAIWGFIQPIIQAIVGFVVEHWNNLVRNVQTALAFVWGIITSVWHAIWGFIQPIIQAIVGFIVQRWNNIVRNVRTALNAIWGVIKNIWNKITGFIQGAMDKIGSIVGTAWDFMGGVGEAVLDGIKKAVNFVIKMINVVIDGINWAIDLANKLPGPDIPRIPKVPLLAGGGIVSPSGGGTLAMIAEAGRPERVEPLDPQGLSRRDRAMIAQLSGGSGDTFVVVKIGDQELRGIVSTEVHRTNDDLAGALATGRKAS